MTDPADPRHRALRFAAFAALALGAAALGGSLVALLREPPTRLALERLDIVEPDGTPRLIIASAARFPGSFDRGKEVTRPDRAGHAGVLFINDEGTENGGLIQSGKLTPQGVDAGLSLTFDRFRQDQVLQLLHVEDGDQAGTGIMINDRPSHRVFSITEMLDLQARTPPAELRAKIKEHRDAGHLGNRRAFLGTERGEVSLHLHDPQGRARLRLAVSSTGEPALELLDADGKVVRSFSATAP